MTTIAQIRSEDGFFIGEDFPINFRVFSFERCRLSLAAGAAATSLQVEPLKAALSSGDKLHFGRAGFIATLSGPASVGATTIAVTALPGPLLLGDDARKVKDLTGLTLEWVLESLPSPDAAGTAILTKTPSLVNDPADPDGSPSKLAQVTVLAADMGSEDAGNFFHRLRQTDSGSLRTLAAGDVVLRRD